MLENFSLVWTKYGNDIALGIRNLTLEPNQELMERIHTLFFNYEITNGQFYTMRDGYFGYFLIPEERMSMIEETENPLFDEFIEYIADSPDWQREEFLRQYKLTIVS